MGLEIKTTANRVSTWSITSKITDKLRHHKRTVTSLRKQWKKFETRSTFHIFSIVFKSSCWTQITYKYSFFLVRSAFDQFYFPYLFPRIQSMALFHLTMLESSDGPNQICHVAVSLECHHRNLFQNCRRGLEKKKLLTYLFILKKSIIQFLIKCFGLFSKLQVNQSKKRCI